MINMTAFIKQDMKVCVYISAEITKDYTKALDSGIRFHSKPM